jgi:hypothetical protein
VQRVHEAQVRGDAFEYAQTVQGQPFEPRQRLVFLNLRSDIAFADRARRVDTVLHQLRGIFMKTSNLVALVIALIITTGGFEAINLLFTQAASSHERPSEALTFRA